MQKVRRWGRLVLIAVGIMAPVVVFGVLFAHQLRGVALERGLDHATRRANDIARVGAQPVIDRAGEKGFSDESVRRLDALTEGNSAPQSVEIYGQDLQVIYSSDHSRIGETAAGNTKALDALKGRVVRVVESGSGPDVLRVYIPIAYDGVDPGAVVAVAVPYVPIVAAAEKDTRELEFLLIGGLAVLTLASLSILIRVSRRLRRQAAHTHHQALHDSLTELPNRALFRQRIRDAIVSAQRDDTRLAVMLMDLDRFKEVNDTLGHHSGDLLLQQIGRRLRSTLREIDTIARLGNTASLLPWKSDDLFGVERIARLGGDEFAILIPNAPDPETTMGLAERILKGLEQPFLIEQLALSVGASIGVAFYPDDGKDADTLVRRADVAMYVAKESRSGFELYQAEHDQYSPDRLVMVGELRRALERDELVLHYQPKADMRTGEITDVEVLLRWNHPTRGLLYPDDFIPLAEHTGLIRALSMYVLERALWQCRSWHKAGIEIGVAVNLSVRNLLDLLLPQDIGQLLDRWGLEAHWLELEITESTIMADPQRAMEVLDKLNAMGIKIAIDDFGTGYSSLTYLKQLPVGSLKIDKSFVTNMMRDENDALIVKSTIDLGHNLGVTVVAEGVETKELWDELLVQGCDIGQGFWLSRPISGGELVQWLRSYKAKHAKIDETIAS